MSDTTQVPVATPPRPDDDAVGADEARRAFPRRDAQARARRRDDGALVAATSLLVLLAAALVAATVGFALDVRLGAWIVAPAVLVEALITAHAWRRLGHVRPGRATLATLVGVWLAFLVASVAAASVNDTSTDGRHYQGESVWKLVGGWNPLRSPALATSRATPYLFTNAYGKAIWILQAIVMRSHGSFESAKVVPIMLLLAAALVAFVVARRLGLQPGVAAVAAATLAFNPVTLEQIATHMVDGALASLLLAAIAFVLLALDGVDRGVVLPALASALVLLVGTKTTGLVLACVVVFGTAIVATLVRRSFGRDLAVVLTVVASVAVGTLAIAYNPYVSNEIRYSSPFYPAFGSNSADLLKQYETGDMVGKSAPARLAISLVSKSGSRTSPKLPFVASVDEFEHFKLGIVPFGGFGPLFSGALLLALASIVLVLIERRRSRRPVPRLVTVCLVVAGCCAVASLAIPASFVARYAPEIWVAVAAVLVAGCTPSAPRSARRAAGIGLAVLAFNAGAVAAAAVDGQMSRSSHDSHSLHRLQAMHVVFQAEFGSWPPAEARRLHEHHIAFVAVARVSCAKPWNLTVDGQLHRRSGDAVHGPVSGVLLCPGAARR